MRITHFSLMLPIRKHSDNCYILRMKKFPGQPSNCEIHKIMSLKNLNVYSTTLIVIIKTIVITQKHSTHNLYNT